MPEAEEIVSQLPAWKKGLFALFMALTPILGIAAIEGGARFYFWLRHGIPGKRYGVWRPDPVFGAVPKENGYNSMGETDNWGFRNHEDVYDPKPPGSLRLITYGGSTTFCYQIRTEEAWPARLEQEMRSKRPGGEKDQVLNGGAVMWSIGQINARLRQQVPALRPDYVLIYSGLNEDWNSFLLEKEGVSMAELVRQGHYGVFTKHVDQTSWVKRELFLFKVFNKVMGPALEPLMARIFQRPPADYRTELDMPTLENYRHVLAMVIDVLKENGATPVFIVEIAGIPNRTNTYLTGYSRAGAQLAAEKGAIVIDPSPILSGGPEAARGLFSETGTHYNEAGARKLAAFLFEQLFGGGRTAARPLPS